MWDVQFVPYGRWEVRVGLSVVGGESGKFLDYSNQAAESSL